MVGWESVAMVPEEEEEGETYQDQKQGLPRLTSYTTVPGPNSDISP